MLTISHIQSLRTIKKFMLASKKHAKKSAEFFIEKCRVFAEKA